MDEIKTDGKKKKAPSQAAFIQLMAALVILGTALLLRTFLPEQTKAFLQKYVAGGMDYTAVLGEVGDSIRAFVLGVPHPNESDAAVQAEASPPESDSTEQETVLPDDDPNGINLEPEDTYDPENEPPPETPSMSGQSTDPLSQFDPDVRSDDTQQQGFGGFDDPVLWADARFLVSQSDEEDNTLPLPFGMQKPDKVDYGVYELPFEIVLPAEGRLTSSFGYRIHPVYGDWRFHYGVDIANAAGTKIRAFAAGTVASVGVSNSYGNYVIISHEGGYATLYAHCKKVNVKTGQTVKMGEKIATMGATGVTTGPHLHFELRLNDSFLNPAFHIELPGDESV